MPCRVAAVTVLSMPRQVSPPGLTLNSAEKPVRTRRFNQRPRFLSCHGIRQRQGRPQFNIAVNQDKPAALDVARQWTPALVLQVYPDFIAQGCECTRFERLGKAPDCGRYAIRDSDAGYDPGVAALGSKLEKSAARSP